MSTLHPYHHTLQQKQNHHSNLNSTTIQKVKISQLFYFASYTQIIFLAIGFISAVINGISFSLLAYFYAQINCNFKILGTTQFLTNANIIMTKASLTGLLSLITSFLMLITWSIVGQRQSEKCKNEYFKKLLHQQMSWYDLNNLNQFTTNFFQQTKIFEQSIKETVPILISTIFMVIFGFAIAFSQGWQLSLLICCLLPFLFISYSLFGKHNQKKKQILQISLNQAFSKSQQAISMIKTIKFLNAQSYLSDKLSILFNNFSKVNKTGGLYQGLGAGLAVGCLFITYGIAYIYAQHLLEVKVVTYDKIYSTDIILKVFFAIFWCCQKLGKIQPCMKRINLGRVSAVKILKILNRKQQIDYNFNGVKLNNLKGIIKFQDVWFAYPKSKQNFILKGLNLQINPSTRNAFVGESGQGKSTLIQLILRYYDPQRGKITLDGIDIRSLNLKWLRSNISYIGQQPILFSATIRENLLIGKTDATDEQISSALKKVNAYGFIQKLEHKLETNVGFNGNQLSGGQKQRIALARIILKNAKIVLLDEATSALDRKNEKDIQEAINKISKGKVLITVAHRIKTIKDFDIIFVINDGIVVEKGKFKQLNKFRNYSDEAELLNIQQQQKFQQQQVKIFQMTQKKIQFTSQQNIQLLRLKYDNGLFTRLFKLNQPCLLAVNIIFSIIGPFSLGIYGLFYARALQSLINIQLGISNNTIGDLLNCIMLIAIGIYCFITSTIMLYTMQYLCQVSTQKLRNMSLNKILKLPMKMFDQGQYKQNLLTSILSMDCQLASRINSNYFSILVQNLSSFLICFCIAITIQWRMTLISVIIMPLIMIVTTKQRKIGLNQKLEPSLKIQSSILLVNQSLMHLRTIQSFTSQQTILLKFQNCRQNKNSFQYIYKSSKNSIQGAMAITLQRFVHPFIFYLGTLIAYYYSVSYINIFMTRNLIGFSAMMFGVTNQWFPNIEDSKTAAVNIFNLLDKKTQQQISQEQHSKCINSTKVKGLIEFKNVTFKYPSRNNIILQNFNMRIQPGKKIAIVGHSGCGKSTIVQILLRLYDISSGQVLLDGVNIKDYNINYLRSIFGVVNQQPQLFNTSINENISFNNESLQTQTIDNLLKELKLQKLLISRQKNYEFENTVGARGSQLSGGQKQRICIARTIFRKPKILLLDEATSALDQQSEQIVQKVLDNISQKMTSIIIAHRFDTIKNCDKIFVLNEGKIVQSGEYKDLINLKGVFYQLQVENISQL